MSCLGNALNFSGRPENALELPSGPENALKLPHRPKRASNLPGRSGKCSQTAGTAPLGVNQPSKNTVHRVFSLLCHVMKPLPIAIEKTSRHIPDISSTATVPACPKFPDVAPGQRHSVTLQLRRQESTPTDWPAARSHTGTTARRHDETAEQPPIGTDGTHGTTAR